MSDIEKNILQPGGQKPSEHDRVIVDVSIYTDNSPVIENQTITFDVGHAEDFGVIKFVDDIVKEMGFDEKCKVLAKPNVLTQTELEFLSLTDKSESELKFEVHLRDIQKVSWENKMLRLLQLAGFWQMSESEKILVSSVMKRRGNKLMKNGFIVRAYKTYKIAIQMLQGSVSVVASNSKKESSSSPNEPRLLLVHCLTNAALCLLRLEHIRHPNGTTASNPFDARKYLIPCIQYCQKAVELEPDYAKAWFRYAKAYAGLGDYQEATDKAEQCVRCLDKQKSNTPNPDSSADQVSIMLKQVQNSLQEWRKKANQQAVEERTRIRQLTLKANRFTNNWFDEDDEVEKLPISVWSNDLAENMMSLHEELEAFGEKMPEYHASCRNKGKTKSHLTTIEDEDSDEM